MCTGGGAGSSTGRGGIGFRWSRGGALPKPLSRSSKGTASFGAGSGHISTTSTSSIDRRSSSTTDSSQAADNSRSGKCRWRRGIDGSFRARRADAWLASLAPSCVANRPGVVCLLRASRLTSRIVLYEFDCGVISVASVAGFGLAEDETDVRELHVPCFILEHPNGTLLWDGGLPSEDLDRTLADQLVGTPFSLGSLDYVAFSHMHYDHLSSLAGPSV